MHCAQFFATAYCLCLGAYALNVSDFLPYGTKAGDREFPAVDDHHVFYQANTPFRIYGRNTSYIAVSSNGLIALSDSYGDYTNSTFESVLLRGQRNPYASVLPFYANIDISASSMGGAIYSRLKSDRNDPAMRKVDSLIHDLCAFETNYQSRIILVVTWDHVGYYNKKTNLTNTFQCVLTTNGNSSFAFFLYAEIQWTKAQPPYDINDVQIGFDSGDKRRAHLEYSEGTRKDFAVYSNSDTRGLWAYKLSYSKNKIVPTFCFSGKVTISPQVAIFEGMPVEFNCSVPRGGSSSRWFIDGIKLESRTTIPGFSYLLNSYVLQIQKVPTSLARVHCECIINIDRQLDHFRKLTSNKAEIRVGVFDAVSNLKGQLTCPASFSLSWSAPAGFTSNHTFCVSITAEQNDSSIDIAINVVIKQQCGIKKTGYTFKSKQDGVNCLHVHKVSVYAVNSYGNGREESVYLVGSEDSDEAVGANHELFFTTNSSQFTVVLSPILLATTGLDSNTTVTIPPTAGRSVLSFGDAIGFAAIGLVIVVFIVGALVCGKCCHTYCDELYRNLISSFDSHDDTSSSKVNSISTLGDSSSIYSANNAHSYGNDHDSNYNNNNHNNYSSTY